MKGSQVYEDRVTMLNSCRVDRTSSKRGLDTTSVMHNDRCPYRPGDCISGLYDVRVKIGSDPLFTTLAASDRESEHEVMVLVINSSILATTADYQQFVADAQVPRALEVPGLASVHRFIFEADHTAIVYDNVRGLPLRKLIERNRRSPETIDKEEAMMILSAIATALDQASSRCAHGYLIPDHVILRDDGIKLVATGLIGALPDTPTLREINRSEHTSRYLAPEVLSGHLAAPCADLYSLGTIAEDLLSESPFRNDGTRVDDPLRHLPPLAIHLIQTAMSDDPNDRRGRLMEFVGALEVALEPPHENAQEESFDDIEGPTLAQPSPDLTQKTDAAMLDKVLRELNGDEEGPSSSEDDLLEREASFAEETVIDLMVEERAKQEENVYDTLPIPLPDEVLPSETPSDAPTKQRMETPSALGLDPDLVKAARVLDHGRSSPISDETEPKPQPPESSRYVPPSPVANKSTLSATEEHKGIHKVATHTGWPIVQAPIVDISSPAPKSLPPDAATLDEAPAENTVPLPQPLEEDEGGDRPPWLHDTMRVEAIPELLSEEGRDEEDESPTEEFQDSESSDSGEPEDEQPEWTKDTDKTAILPSGDSTPDFADATEPPAEKEAIPDHPEKAAITPSVPPPPAPPAEPAISEHLSPIMQEPAVGPSNDESEAAHDDETSQDSYHSIEITVGTSRGEMPDVAQMDSSLPDDLDDHEITSAPEERAPIAEVPPEKSAEPVLVKESRNRVVDVSNKEALEAIVPRAQSTGDIPLSGKKLSSRPLTKTKAAPMIPTASVKWSWALIGALLGGLLLFMYFITFVVIWAID